MADRVSDTREDATLEAMLPVVPEELDVDPVLLALLQCAAFLDFADDGTVDPDAATDVLDHVAYYVRRLPPERRAQMQAQVEKIEAYGGRESWPTELTEFVGDFLDNCTNDDDDDEV